MKQIYIKDIVQLPWDGNVKVLFEVKKEQLFMLNDVVRTSESQLTVERSPSKIGIYKGYGAYCLLRFEFPDVDGDTSMYLSNPNECAYDPNDYDDPDEYYNFFLVDA